MRRESYSEAPIWLVISVLALAVLAGCTPETSAEQASPVISHPLDPLTEDEYVQTLALLRAAGHVNDASRFSGLDLLDPAKASILAWRPGDDLERVAFAVVKQGSQTFEAVVDLSNGSVMSWNEIVDVQSSLLLEEIISVREILSDNDQFVAALSVRGFSIDDVMCAPLTLGNYNIPEHRGRRLVKSPCFVLGDVSNFTRPIEGLGAIVDLNTREVVEIIDQAVIEVSEAPAAVDEASIVSDRVPLKPVVLHQPDGSNFTINGHVLEWDNWKLHYRLEKRSGLVVSTVSYHDKGEWRQVLYQGAVSELFVPYMDPDELWYSRTFMDGGEFGFGANVTPLAPGYDCPDTAVLLDALIPDDKGVATLAADSICIFERNLGDSGWRHFDNATGSGFEGRRAVELVLRMAATIGNYDYFIDWVFAQDGRIKSRIGATGYDGLKGVRAQSMNDSGAESDTAYGTLVAPGLVATNHDHFFSIRLDVDIDGSSNSIAIDRLISTDFAGPRSGWIVESQVAQTESDARLNYNPSQPAKWRIFNRNATGPLGHAPGYVLKPGNSVAYSLLNAGDMAQQRAGFTKHQLWVTPQDDNERYAAGMYVNQSEGGLGLPEWTAANRSIQNTDVVLWYTAGFHHVPRTEDFPIMPSVWHEFELVPFNFFDRNPAIDVPTEWRSAGATDGQ